MSGDAQRGKRAGRLNLLIQNATVVTMNASRDVLRGVDVLVEDGRTVAGGALRAFDPE